MKNLEVLYSILDESQAPVIKNIFQQHVNEIGGEDASDIIFELAKRLGTKADPVEILKLYRLSPEIVGPELKKFDIEIQNGWILTNYDNLHSKKKKSIFQDGWRPALSWLLIWLIVMNSTVFPLINAIYSLDVRLMPWEQIIAFSAIWLTIYSGGHTAKSIFAPKTDTLDVSAGNKKA